MFNPPRCTRIDREVLTRLIAAARVTDSVPWIDAETAAVHEVTSLWGGRTPVEQAAPVEVNTAVLLQLAVAAHAAICSPGASGSEWAVQVVRDVADVRRLAAKN